MFYSHPFRERQSPREYVEWAFGEQAEAECRFGVPLVSGDRAAVDWWGVITSPDGGVETVAGTSLLRFDADGLVLEQRDAWGIEPARRDLPAWAQRGAASAFDFEAYAAAIEAKDVPAWIAFYADDAEWREYRAASPPSSPNVMVGRTDIRAFLDGTADAALGLEVSHAVVGPRRAAYALTVSLADGRTILEHVIVELVDGLIVSQVDVEAWD